MRVGFFTDTYRPNLNGVVISIDSFAEELRRLGCQTVVYAPHGPRDRRFVDLRRLARPVIPRTLPWRARRESDFEKTSSPQSGVDHVHWLPSLRWLMDPEQRIALPIIRRLTQLARRDHLDLIHTQTPFLVGYAGVQTARALGVPLVHTYHTYFAEYGHYLKAGARLGKLAAPLYSRWICNLHDQVLAPSRDIESVLRLYGVRKPIEIQQTGVPVPPTPRHGERDEARATLDLPARARLLLFVGRLAREKNLDLLFEAVRRLRFSDPDFLLLLVGDGPARKHLERKARALGIQHHIRFVGWIPHDQLRSWFVAADLFVFPSVTETQGLSLLEAMGYARPVVAISGPGVRDLIASGRSGLLVEPDPRHLAQGIQSLLRDPANARRLGRGARAVAEKLDARRQALRLHDRYQRLLGEPVRTARRGLRGMAVRAWEEAAAWR